MVKQTKKLNRISRKRVNSDPLVSVVIPVFNGSPYIIEAVESVQKSTFSNLEVILIDDGSADTSKAICRKLSRTYSNVRFFSMRSNRGLGRILNFALKKARGKYICRLNQDDRMLLSRIKTQVRFLDKNPDVTAVGSYIKLFDGNGKSQIIRFLTQDQDIKSIWYIVSPFSDPSVMYRKDVALQVGGYDQYFWPADDTHLWYRMGTAGKLANIPRPLVEVRWHEGAASVKFFRKLAIKTYEMHQWTNSFVGAASILTQFYWICQLVAGVILPPQINWKVYRGIKFLISIYDDWKSRFLNLIVQAKAKIVTPQPARASLSGV